MKADINTLFVLAAIWGFLGFVSLVIWGLVRHKPKKNFQELISRTISWWVILAIFTAALLTSHLISLIFLGFISFLALKEFFSMIPTRRVDRRVLFWAYLAVPVQFYWAGIGWFGMFIIFIPIYMFLFIPFRLLLSQKTSGFLNSTGIIQWGLMITVFTLSHIAFLFKLPERSPYVSGIGLLVYLVFLTQFNDVAQYICGKWFGRKSILPVVSPKKTWGGFWGGVTFTSLLSLVLYSFITPFSFFMAWSVGVLISIAGFIGDVTISAIKRDIGVKDTGSMIPGHGGILDRVDSLTFSAPLFFHFVYYFYY